MRPLGAQAQWRQRAGDWMPSATVGAPTRCCSALFTAIVSVAFLAGCETDSCVDVACGPCQSPLNVSVLDGETGEPVAQASISGDFSATCQRQGTQTICHLGDSATSPGTYSLTVRADGYLSTEVTATLAEGTDSGCCACGYTALRLTVTLARLPR